MPSVQSKDIDDTYRRYRVSVDQVSVDQMIAKSFVDGVALSMSDFRTLSFLTLTREPTGVAYMPVNAGGIPSIRVDPQEGAKDRVVLFFHGGADIHGTANGYPDSGRLAAHPWVRDWPIRADATVANCQLAMSDNRNQSGVLI